MITPVRNIITALWPNTEEEFAQVLQNVDAGGLLALIEFLGLSDSEIVYALIMNTYRGFCEDNGITPHYLIRYNPSKSLLLWFEGITKVGRAGFTLDESKRFNAYLADLLRSRLEHNLLFAFREHQKIENVS